MLSKFNDGIEPQKGIIDIKDHHIAKNKIQLYSFMHDLSYCHRGMSSTKRKKGLFLSRRLKIIAFHSIISLSRKKNPQGSNFVSTVHAEVKKSAPRPHTKLDTTHGLSVTFA